MVAEGTVGGFAAVYRVLSALEETGRIRRGYFVEGLGAAQFASAGAVDRVRAFAPSAGRGPGSPGGLVLAAADPANPVRRRAALAGRGRQERRTPRGRRARRRRRARRTGTGRPGGRAR